MWGKIDWLALVFQVQCPITGLEFAAAYTAMVEDMAIADPETGEYCSVSVDQGQGTICFCMFNCISRN